MTRTLVNIRVWKPGSPSSGSFLPPHQALRCSASPPSPTPASVNNLKLDGIALREHQEEGAGAESQGHTHTRLTAVLSPGRERHQRTQEDGRARAEPQNHPLPSETGCTRCRDARCYSFLGGQEGTWASQGPRAGNTAIDQAQTYLQP